MGNLLEIRGSLLARNTAWNLFGQAAPMIVGLATIPYVVHGLGTEQFGILSIAWVVLGYFSLFDLGLGRATTKFVAEALGRGELDRLPGLMWTCLGSQLILGVAGSLMLGVFVPVLVGRILKIPPGLLFGTKLCFWILAVSLPIVLATAALRSGLEAAQRFDLVNYVKVPASISVFALPAIALALGFGLPGITLLLVLSRLAAAVAYYLLCLKVLPGFRGGFLFERANLRPLVTYGGWVTLSNIVNPILVYVDRFLIGSLISATALGYYTAPFDAVTRLWVVPVSLAATLFPAFSSLGNESDRTKLETVYWRAFKTLLLILGPLVLIVVTFAKEILALWLGADFAAHSAVVLQILAVGVLANSFAYVPYSLLQGLGRPDAVSKLLLFELPVYAGLAYVIIARKGIVGAALIWSLRVGIEALLLVAIASKVFSLPVRMLVKNGLLRGIAAFAALAAVILAGRLIFGTSSLLHYALAAFALGVFPFAVWRYILDDADRGPVFSMIRPFLAKMGRAS